MQVQRGTYTFGDNFLEKIGGGVMDAFRSGVGVFTKLRGDTGNQVVEGAAQTNYANLAVYGTLAALALLVVVKAPRKR